jgi:hypothetical protein
MNNQFNIKNQLNSNTNNNANFSNFGDLNNNMNLFNQMNNNNFQKNFNSKNNNRGFNNNNFKNQNLNNKESKCPKCNQLIDNKLLNDHLLCHQIDDAQRRRHHGQNINNNDLRFNRHIRNHMNNMNNMNNQRLRINNHTNNNHNNSNNPNNQNHNDNGFNFINGFLNFIQQGLEIGINNANERNINNPNNNMQNRNNNNNNNNRNRNVHFRPHIIGVRIINGRHRSDLHGKHAINHFPEIVIEDVGKLDEGNKKCIICLEEFKNKEKVTALPCIHFFHTPCIKDWVKKQKSCPICKFELTQENLNQKMKENSK